jgi:hypothetical protein
VIADLGVKTRTEAAMFGMRHGLTEMAAACSPGSGMWASRAGSSMRGVLLSGIVG